MVMSLTPDQAADSLKEIERTRSRSASVRGYANSSPFLLMWGGIWVVGYSVSDLAPHYASPLWLGLTVLGFAGSLAIGRFRAAQGDPHPGLGRKAGLRFVAMFVTLFFFILATYAIFGRVSPAQQAAFVPLIVAQAYTVLGIWKGVRFLVTGIAIAALTLGGFFFLHQHFLLWMAFVGGGSMILAGLWLRKV
jgi:hypothetical protein